MKFSLDQSLGFITNRTANRLRAELVNRFKQKGYDITPDQWSVLNRLSEEDGLSQNTLGKRVAKDKTNIARIVTLMEKKGLVRREADETDRRQLNIYLTEEGENISEQLQNITESILEDAQRGLSADDVAHTIGVLNQIYENLS